MRRLEKLNTINLDSKPFIEIIFSHLPHKQFYAHNVNDLLLLFDLFYLFGKFEFRDCEV